MSIVQRVKNVKKYLIFVTGYYIIVMMVVKYITTAGLSTKWSFAPKIYNERMS